jgi:hypothetical protein
MSAPLTVSIPHRLGREEAVRRLKTGLASVRANYSNLIAVDREEWAGDKLDLSMRALGQHSSGSIEVFENHLLIEITLPWLLAKFAERVVPTIRKEATLLLEKQ